uniref:CHK kinase-like domain-containing protein n=2 Tax=Lygus hesperus TaxID=30085 RepID=A0A146MDU1_LYGHE
MEPHVEILLRDIASKEGLLSSFRATVNSNVNGKSFHGIVKSIILEDSSKRLPLILKQCHTDGLTRDVQKTHDKFNNEVLFYSEVVERIRAYGPLPRIPRYYGSLLTESMETIVLEDLREDNFVLKPLSEGLDIIHLNMVAKALAKLHDASEKWKDNNPDSFWQTFNLFKETFFISHADQECQKLATLLHEHALKSALMCVPPDLGNQCSDYIRNSMLARLEEMTEWVKPLNRDRFTTVLHGDAWCHNFMFKYDSNGDPVEVALIDWQMVRLGSPALDLLECFLSSADNSTLMRPMDFVATYSDARSLQSSDLMKDFHRWGRPGLLIAMSILVNVLTQGDNTIAVKFEEAVKSNGIDSALKLETQVRIRSVLRTAESLGLFQE